jgi:hypothetical protein
VIQEKIGEGLKTGALTPNEGRVHLARLENFRRDYRVLRDKLAYREEWDTYFRSLDVFEGEVNRDLSRPVRILPRVEEPPPVVVPPRVEELPRIEDRIVALQRRIDDGRSTGRLSPAEGRDLQARLDAIRSDYSRLAGRTITYEERADIWRRLDLVETDLNRFR